MHVAALTPRSGNPCDASDEDVQDVQGVQGGCQSITSLSKHLSPPPPHHIRIGLPVSVVSVLQSVYGLSFCV